MTDTFKQPTGAPPLGYHKPEPFLTLRSYVLIAVSLLVTLLFVREYRHQQGPCRTEFKMSHSLQAKPPRLLRVQDDANPGSAGLPADPCRTQTFFGATLQQTYAALTLVLWGVTTFSAAKDLLLFRTDRRRRRMRLAYLAEIESQANQRRNS